MNYQEYLNLCKSRESCRSYSGRAVSRDDLHKMIDAAILSPSAKNTQPWSFVAVSHDSPNFASVVDATHVNGRNQFTDNAGGFIVILEEAVDYGIPATAKPRYWGEVDVGIATMSLCLAATSLGLSTCIMGLFDPDKVRECLNIPAEKKPKLVLAVGYADSDKLREKSRKPFEAKVTDK